MGQHQFLFIILGVIFIGIALLTEYFSTNNASGWTAANIGLPGTSNQAVAVRCNNIFAGNSDKGEALSTHNSSIWVNVNNRFLNSNNHSITVSSNKIFTGSNRGSAWLNHMNEISPVQLYGFNAMAKHSSSQFN